MIRWDGIESGGVGGEMISREISGPETRHESIAQERERERERETGSERKTEREEEREGVIATDRERER